MQSLRFKRLQETTDEGIVGGRELPTLARTVQSQQALTSFQQYALPRASRLSSTAECASSTGGRSTADSALQLPHQCRLFGLTAVLAGDTDELAAVDPRYFILAEAHAAAHASLKHDPTRSQQCLTQPPPRKTFDHGLLGATKQSVTL